MARQLIESLSTDFDPAKYRDEYRERVLELIERKAEGQEIAVAAGSEEPRPGARPDGRAGGQPRRPCARRGPARQAGGGKRRRAAQRPPRRQAQRARRLGQGKLGLAQGRGARRQEAEGQGCRRRTARQVRGRGRGPPAVSSPTSTRCSTRRSGFTKGQVIDYYTRDRAGAAAAPARPAADAEALPERRRGPVLLREAVPVASPRLGADGADQHQAGGTIDFCLVDDLPTLVWLANLADLELHTVALARRGHRAADDDGLRPRSRRAGRTRRVLRGGAAAARAARRSSGWSAFRRRRARRAFRSTCRSTRPVTYDETKPFAHAMAQLLEKQHPEAGRVEA